MILSYEIERNNYRIITISIIIRGRFTVEVILFLNGQGCHFYILLQALGRCSFASAGDPIFSVSSARSLAQSESSTVTSCRHLDG
jgi:hypothetical protein